MGDNVGNGGIGFLGALTLLFIGLKLGKVIDWSWWMVLSPILVGALVIVCMLVVFLIIWLVQK